MGYALDLRENYETTREAGERLKCDERHVAWLCRNGLLPAVKSSATWHIPRGATPGDYRYQDDIVGDFDYVGLTEAARILDVGRGRVRRRIQRGTLPAVKSEWGRWLVPRDSLAPTGYQRSASTRS